MTILNKLASSLNRKDEAPDRELAKQIARENDKDAVYELVKNLGNKDKNLQSDCIKVLYEIGAIKPAMIVGFTEEFVKLLEHENNRLQWGAMMALDLVTPINPKEIYKALGKIIDAADKGSVITNDHCVKILIRLCAIKEYAKDAFSLLIERLRFCPVNQLPAYAEKALPIVSNMNKRLFIDTLTSRLVDVDVNTKRVRIEKLIQKLAK